MSKAVLKKANRSRTSNPTLDTIKMVEQALSKESQYTSKNRLWRTLPRQVQYPTFKAVLDYLEESNKIMYDKDGTIIWTFVESPKLKKLLKSCKSLL